VTITFLRVRSGPPPSRSTRAGRPAAHIRLRTHETIRAGIYAVSEFPTTRSLLGTVLQGNRYLRWLRARRRVDPRRPGRQKCLL